jgi:hypothetical protein
MTVTLSSGCLSGLLWDACALALVSSARGLSGIKGESNEGNAAVYSY